MTKKLESNRKLETEFINTRCREIQVHAVSESNVIEDACGGSSPQPPEPCTQSLHTLPEKEKVKEKQKEKEKEKKRKN